MSLRKIRIGLAIDYLTSEYSESLIKSIQNYCEENNVDLLVFPIGELNKQSLTFSYQNTAVSALINKYNIDGLIMTSGTQMHRITKKQFLTYLEGFYPVPIISISAPIGDFPYILGDCDRAYEEMLQHLIDTQNCKKFGFVDVETNSLEVKRRRDIFKKVMERNGISMDDVQFWQSKFEYASTYNVLLNFLKDNNYHFDVDTIIALNDDMAYACIDFVKNHLNKRVPEDVIVTGVDDLQRASFSNPTLTSVNQRVGLQGYKAAETLVKMIHGEAVPKKQIIHATAYLRESTERVPLISRAIPPTKYLAYDLITPEVLHDKFSVSEWYTKRSQIFSASRFYVDMNQDQTYEILPEVLTDELMHFGFQSAFVVMYDEPVIKDAPYFSFELPESAKLIAGFNYDKGYNLKKTKEVIRFNPRKEMIPSSCIKYTTKGYVVCSLFHRNCLYGYVVLSCGDYDVAVYELIARSIGAKLAGCLRYTKMVEEHYTMKDRYQRLDIIAHTDELTGIKNRRGFRELGNSMMNFNEAMNQSGLVVFSDMDGLKKINDSYGHDEGDIAIKAQAKILSDNFRSNDLVARLAGDEFAIISPGLSENMFDMIRDTIEKECIEWSIRNNKPYRLSISLGVIEYPDPEVGYNLNLLLSMADGELYKEKRHKKSLNR